MGQTSGLGLLRSSPDGRLAVGLDADSVFCGACAATAGDFAMDCCNFWHDRLPASFAAQCGRQDMVDGESVFADAFYLVA